MDISSLFIGLFIGIIGAFGTGFLKKAGEDLYSSLKGKINPKSTAAVSPQVVVHLHDDRSDRQAGSTTLGQCEPDATGCLSQVSFDDIEKAINSSPPMQREHIANSYIGLKVNWDTYLRSAKAIENGEIYLRLAIDRIYQGRSVYCNVQTEEYRVLGVLPEGAHIRVAGEITKASTFAVELSNVRLQFIKNDTAS